MSKRIPNPKLSLKKRNDAPNDYIIALQTLKRIKMEDQEVMDSCCTQWKQIAEGLSISDGIA